MSRFASITGMKLPHGLCIMRFFLFKKRKTLQSTSNCQAGQRRAEKRHKFMEEFLKEFHEEWSGKA